MITSHAMDEQIEYLRSGIGSTFRAPQNIRFVQALNTVADPTDLRASGFLTKMYVSGNLCEYLTADTRRAQKHATI